MVNEGTRESIAQNPIVPQTVDRELEMVMTIEDTGLMVIYRTTNGEPVKILKYMLAEYLRAENADGSAQYTTSKPASAPKRGTLKCLLHPAGENREHYNELGLPLCKKSNISAPYMVEQHMKKRHPSAWAIIEQERIEREKQEDKEFQRFIVKELAKATKK